MNLWPHDFYFYKPPHPKAIIVKIYGGFQHQGFEPLQQQSLEGFLVGNGFAVLVVNLADTASTLTRQQLYPETLLNQVLGQIADIPQHLVPRLIKGEQLPIFLMGWSFGGVLTQLAALTKDAYDGYIAIAAPTNPEIDNNMSMPWTLALPTHLSPLKQIDGLKKPLLIVQGMQDSNVIPQHALEFYKAAQDNHRESFIQLAFIEDMPHEILLNAAFKENLLGFIERTIQKKQPPSSESIFKRYQALCWANDPEASKEEQFLGRCWQKYLQDASCRDLHQKETWNRCYATLMPNHEKHLIPFQNLAQKLPGQQYLPQDVRKSFQKEHLIQEAGLVYGNPKAFLTWFQDGYDLNHQEFNQALNALEAAYMDARVGQKLKQLSNLD